MGNLPKILETPRGTLNLPLFLPDGTQGVVRSVDSQDVGVCHIQAVQMNVFHLMQRPGSSTIQALGGLHKMSGWQRPIFTDSGGFQIYSLLRQRSKRGSINDKGASFKPEGSDRKFNLTPEKSVQLQLNYGSDVVICLDDCTHVDDPLSEQEKSVQRTVSWAKRCRKEFDHIISQRKGEKAERKRPLLIAVVQGGNEASLRQRCAEQLLEIGFDGYGYGGWPLDSDGNLLVEMVETTRNLIPDQFTLHGLGIGHPESIVACTRLGYNIFDSTMPTRDARHGRLYTFTQDPRAGKLNGRFFKYIYPGDDKHKKKDLPVCEFNDSPVNTHYSLGYLHHLFKVGDSLFPRLATMHNLRFMTLLMESLRQFG